MNFGVTTPVIVNIIFLSLFSFKKSDLMNYMENALNNVPERDSSGSRNTSSGPRSTLSGSATPTEEMPTIGQQQPVSCSAASHESASRMSSSLTDKYDKPNFVSALRQREEVIHANRERQGGKSHSGAKISQTESPGVSKGKVSFESDLSVATPGVPPLDLSAPTSSSDITPVSSSQTTPADSPRHNMRQSILKQKPFAQHVVKSSQRPVERPRSSVSQKHPSGTEAQRSKSAVPHANISTRDKRRTMHDVTNQNKYYDMDMRTFQSAGLSERSNQYLRRGNPESYMSTPEIPRYEDSPVRGATSLNDIKYVLDEIEAVPHFSHSEDNMLEWSQQSSPSDARLRRTSGSNANSRFHQKSRPDHLYFSEAPSKCQSLPNVVDSQNSTHFAHSRLPEVPSRYDASTLMPAEVLRKKLHSQQIVRRDSDDSLLSPSDEGYVPVSDQDKSKCTPRSKRRGEAFGNHERSQSDLNVSDTDSMKSFASTSSISRFNHALQAKVNTRYTKSDRFQSEPIRSPVSNVGSIDHALARGGNSQAIQRPIAMVTRHTQMPSPGPTKMPKPRQT